LSSPALIAVPFAKLIANSPLLRISTCTSKAQASLIVKSPAGSGVFVGGVGARRRHESERKG
jgi:hypothetical protein